MKTLLTLALTLLSSCTTDYIQSASGSRLYLGQVGGQKAIERTTVDGITVEGYGIDNETSFKDAMDFAGTWAAIQGAVSMAESANATELGKVKSGDKLSATDIKEGEKTTRHLSDNALKEAELPFLSE